MPRRILLSYAREDAALVTEIAADLRALDHEVWVDQDLEGGQDWWDEILARIRWCDAFVPVLSAASLRSRACTGERDYALALERPVLPVVVGSLGPEGLLDEDLARRQRIQYGPADKASTLRLLAAAHRLPPAPPLPSVEPTPPPTPMAYLGALRAELDGAAHVDFDRQLTLLGRLSAEAEDTDRHPEVTALVRIFLHRQDVAAFVQRQLATLQSRLGPVPTAGHEPERVAPDAEREMTSLRYPRAEVVQHDGSLFALDLCTAPNERMRLTLDRGRPPDFAVVLDGRTLPFYGHSGHGYRLWRDYENGVKVAMSPTDGSLTVDVNDVRVFDR